MTWDAYHRRQTALRELLTIADSAGRTSDLDLADLLDTVDPDRTALADEAATLRELHMVWFRRLSSHVDRLTADGTTDFELTALEAWVRTAAELPSVRALLDAHRDDEALTTAIANEQAFIAASAGVSVGRGARIIETARETPVVRVEEESSDRHPLISFLRSAFAA